MENDVQAFKVLKNLVHGEANAKALYFILFYMFAIINQLILYIIILP